MMMIRKKALHEQFFHTMGKEQNTQSKKDEHSFLLAKNDFKICLHKVNRGEMSFHHADLAQLELATIVYEMWNLPNLLLVLLVFEKSEI